MTLHRHMSASEANDFALLCMEVGLDRVKLPNGLFRKFLSVANMSQLVFRGRPDRIRHFYYLGVRFDVEKTSAPAA